MTVRTGIDIGRLGAALQRPGIDTRIWLSLAVVEDVAFDADDGMYADVIMQPGGNKETVIIGSDYAGPDYGSYMPLKVSDVILVAVPCGDPGFGPIFLKKIWSKADPPPAEFQNPNGADAMDATNDATTVVEPATTYKIVARRGAKIRLEAQDGCEINLVTTGSGKINITSESTITVNSPDVRLGDSPGAAVARIGDLVIGSIPLPSPAAPTPFVAQIASGKNGVKA